MVRPDWELEEAPYGCSEPWQNAALLTQSVIRRVRVAQIHSPVGGMLCRPLSVCTDVSPQRLMGRRVCGRLIWLKVNGVTRAIADGCLTPAQRASYPSMHACEEHTYTAVPNINETPRSINLEVAAYISWRCQMQRQHFGHILDAYSLTSSPFLCWNVI